jgi:hypothetical protein
MWERPEPSEFNSHFATLFGRHGASVGSVTRLGAEPRNYGLIPGRGKRVFLIRYVHTGFGLHPAFWVMCNVHCSPCGKGAGA